MTTITDGTIIPELVGAYLGFRFLLQRGMVNVEPNQTRMIQFLRVDGTAASRAFLAARRYPARDTTSEDGGVHGEVHQGR